MNSTDRKNLYTPLTEAMDNGQRHSQPPAYESPQPMQQQNQQTTTQLAASAPVQAQPQVQQQYQPMNMIGVTGPTAEIMMVNTPNVGPNPMVVTCPHCRARSKTTIRYKSTSNTHLGCLLLSWTCCCCIPYCMRSCQNANHYCSMCDAFIGSYRS